MEFPQFFELIGRRFKIPLVEATNFSSLNYQTVLNQRCRGICKLPIEKCGRLLMVSAADLHHFLFGQGKQKVGRGRPTKVEQIAARRLGLTVQEYRRQGLGEVQHVAP